MHHFKQKKTNCRLTNLNLRKEMHGEEQVLAADLGIQVSLPKSVLDDLSIDKGLPWEGLLWDKDQNVRSHGLKDLGFKLKFKDHLVKVTVGEVDMTFDRARLVKFVATPTDGGRVDLTYSIQVYPKEEELAPLSSAILGTISVKIAPMQIDVTENEETEVENQE